MAEPVSGAGELALRIVGIVLTAVFGIPFLLVAWVALSSRFGGPGGDPHGYALIFGTFAAVVLAVPAFLCLPLAFRRGRRAVALAWSGAALVLTEVVLIVSLLTA